MLVRMPNETRCLTEWLVDGFREKVRDADVVVVSEVIKKYGLQARIIGAADSETGTPEITSTCETVI